MAARIRNLMAVLAGVATLAMPVRARAQQQPDTTAFFRALDLEGAGKFKEAAALYRQSLAIPKDRVNALLGLERAYAELNWTDSLLVPLDSLIGLYPNEPVYRGVELRAYTMLARDADAHRAFDAWVKAAPGKPDPYREYARVLLERGRAAAADSIIQLAGHSLGSTSSLDMELAESRSALGQWGPAAMAWRGALIAMPDLDQAAAYSLTQASEAARDTIRRIFLSLPVDIGARRAMSELEMSWGSASDGWAALRDLEPDSASVAAWMDFARSAEADEQWGLVRDALVAALKWKPNPDLSLRAATAALNAGDPATALALAPRAGLDSAQAAATILPLRVRALSAYGKPAQAEQLVEQFAHLVSPLQRASLEQSVAFGWVRSGDLDKARAALKRAGSDADSSDAAGWLALYEGNLDGARSILKNSTDASPQLAQALGLITRIRDDSAADVGAAFLALARVDSAGAARAFEAAAPHHGDAASAMLAMAAQIDAARRDTANAARLWARILKEYAESPEAAGAELAWARQLRRTGDVASATTHLEHMILTYPESALVPQARRELELTRQAIPGGGGSGGAGGVRSGPTSRLRPTWSVRS
jgi:tetratricopeptide (TPR) repeat protein